MMGSALLLLLEAAAAMVAHARSEVAVGGWVSTSSAEQFRAKRHGVCPVVFLKVPDRISQRLKMR